MKIREDLVFDKSTGEITSLVDNVQYSLDHRFVMLKEQYKKQTFENKKVATHMPTLIFSLNAIFPWLISPFKVCI